MADRNLRSRLKQTVPQRASLTAKNSKLSSSTSNQTSAGTTTPKENPVNQNLSTHKATKNQVKPKVVSKVQSSRIDPPPTAIAATTSSRVSITNRVTRPSTSQRESISPNLEDKITLIQARVASVEEKNLPFAEKIATLESRITATDLEIARLKAENSNLRLSVASLKSDNEALQFVTAELTQLESKFAELKSQEELIQQLHGDFKSLEKRIEDLNIPQISNEKGISIEQHLLNNNIIIRGVDIDVNSTEADLLAVYDKIRTHLGVSDISDLKAVSAKLFPPLLKNNKKTSPRPLQIQLSSVAAKKKFLQVRKIKKDILPSEIGIQQPLNRAILVTEQLTRSNQQLLFQARSLRSGNNYKFVWSTDGQILARFRQNDKVIRIRDLTHVNQLRAELDLEPIIEDGRHHTPNSFKSTARES